jgi:hypothetical protein
MMHLTTAVRRANSKFAAPAGLPFQTHGAIVGQAFVA